jgi:hypothetical protein
MGNSVTKKEIKINDGLFYYHQLPKITGDFDLIIYKLIWLKKPKLLSFINLGSELITKEQSLTLDSILDYSNNFVFSSYKNEIYNPRSFLFYIITNEGILITKKIAKVKIYIPLVINNLIRISIVDISKILKNDPFYFSFYEIKKASKYYFDLSLCKIDLSDRSQNIDNSSKILLSDNEIELDDIEQKENEERENELVINTNLNEKINKKTSKFLFDGNYIQPIKKYLNINEKNYNIEEDDNNSEISYQSDKLIIDNNTNKFSISFKKYYSKPQNLITVLLRNGVPFDKRQQKNIIEKIVLKLCDYGSNNPKGFIYLKELINMLIEYENLKKFAFYENEIPESKELKIWNQISKLLLDNFSIRWICFKNSNLTSRGLDIILPPVHMKRIRYLDLSYNTFNDNSMKKLSIIISENKTLKRIYLNNTEITNIGLKKLSKGIFNHPNLNLLNLSYCKLPNSGSTLYNIITNSKIHTLLIRKIALNLEDFKSIKKSLIINNCNINYLDLGFNPINDNSQNEILGSMIKNNNSIKKICLDGMNINMLNYMPLFIGIYYNQTIESFSFNQNKNLSIEGVLNFFLNNEKIKEISIIPWENNEKNKTFSQEDIKSMKAFHLKNPQVQINGFVFNDNIIK